MDSNFAISKQHSEHQKQHSNKSEQPTAEVPEVKNESEAAAEVNLKGPDTLSPKNGSDYGTEVNLLTNPRRRTNRNKKEKFIELEDYQPPETKRQDEESKAENEESFSYGGEEES